MVVVSILPHAEFGRNDLREYAPHFIFVPSFRKLQAIVIPWNRYRFRIFLNKLLNNAQVHHLCQVAFKILNINNK